MALGESHGRDVAFVVIRESVISESSVNIHFYSAEQVNAFFKSLKVHHGEVGDFESGHFFNH